MLDISSPKLPAEVVAIEPDAERRFDEATPEDPGAGNPAFAQSMDATAWAKEWCRIARKIEEESEETGGKVIDEGWMIGWFSNAIMRGWDTGRRELQAEIDAQPPAAPSVVEPLDRILRLDVGDGDIVVMEGMDGMRPDQLGRMGESLQVFVRSQTGKQIVVLPVAKGTRMAVLNPNPTPPKEETNGRKTRTPRS